MSNEKTTITWQCYPSNIETFDSVNFPVVNDAIASRQHYLEKQNNIDHLPNFQVPDDTGPVVNFEGPHNSEPVRPNQNLSVAPIVVMTDVEPGMIMPGNISVSLPQYLDEHPQYIYPHVDQEFNHDANNSLHGHDVLTQPNITSKVSTVDIHSPSSTVLLQSNTATPHPLTTIPEPTVSSTPTATFLPTIPATQAPTEPLNKSFNMASTNVPATPVITTAVPTHTQVPILNSINAAIPLETKKIVHQNEKTVVHSEPKHDVVVHSEPKRKSHKNKLMHKALIYIAIALIIYLIYVILFEKN